MSLKTYATGGVADIYIMLGDTPNDVVKKYHDIIGKPVLSPQWALGWHQCKWGYKDTSEIIYSVNDYINN